LAGRDLPKRCQVANNERWDLPYTAKTVSSCKKRCQVENNERCRSRIQELGFSEFGWQGPAVYRSGDSQSLAARDLPYTGVECLRVWLPGTCRIQEWGFSEFGCQRPALYRSGESQSLAARDLPYLSYTGVESLGVWLPGTCPIQEWGFSEFGCQGPAVCKSGVTEFGCQGPALYRSGESQSLVARDLPKRCQVANNERWDLPYTAKTVSSCK